MACKILIGIVACHNHLERVQAQRDSWIKHIPPDVSYKFFFGHGDRELNHDEIGLDVDDDYFHLVHKVRAMCQWAIAHDYTNLFKCDTDTWIFPDRLISNSDFGKYDYIGLEGFRATRSYAMGGPGYWLSRKAMEIVANSNLYLAAGANRISEDVYVGKMLRSHGISLHIDSRYVYRGYCREIITECELDPQEMREKCMPESSLSDSQKITMATGIIFKNPA